MAADKGRGKFGPCGEAASVGEKQQA
jgi:hypothetical protein